MNTKPQSLDTPVGGEAGIAQFVDAFYGRVLADPELKGFFERSPIEKLTAIERGFFRGGAQAGQSSILRSAAGNGALRAGHRQTASLAISRSSAGRSRHNPFDEQTVYEVIIRISTAG